MKKFFKWLFILIVTVYGGLFIMDKLDTRPFRFEDFKTAQEFESFLRNKHQIGQDIEILISSLKNSGAKCKKIIWRATLPKNVKEYDIAYECEYYTGWISLHPLLYYSVSIMGDKNKKLVYLGAEHFNLPN